MAHKFENLKLKNSNGEQLTYTTITFMDAEEYDALVGVHKQTLPGVPFEEYKDKINFLFYELIGETRFIDFAKPIITGLTSNANILTISNNMAYAFASAMPQAFDPFGPYRAGQTDNEFIINGNRYAFFGGSGTNEGGAYTLASSLYRYSNPIPDSTSKTVLANTGTIAQTQQNSTLFAYFLNCKVSDLDDPWNTIIDYRVFKILLYYGGNQGSSYSSKYLYLELTGGSTADNTTHDNFIADLKGTSPDDHFKPGEGEDPNEPGGTSTTGGGGGTFDNTSDTIGVPGLPTLSAVDTGLLTIYNPTIAEIKSLANFLWNANATTVEFWKKLISDPLDLVIGFSMVPCQVPDGGRQTVKVGFIDTGVSMTLAESQYVEVNCGTLNIQEFWKSALDFANYTKVQLFLPYIGFIDLDTDDIMGKVMGVKYHIDILTGSFTCFVTVDGSVHYQYLGQCSQLLPLNASNFSSMISAALGIASSGAGMLMSGGASAAITGAENIAQNVMSLKPTVKHSGTVSGSGAFLGVQTPYLLAERPRQSLPQNYPHYSGYPANITETLGNLKGYTEVESIHLHDIPATAEELKMIEEYLKAGVIIS